jgi:hypothetical protein
MSIIRRLDLDADARLSLSEFREGLTPSDPYSKCLKRFEMGRKPIAAGKGIPLQYQEGTSGAKYDDIKVRACDKMLTSHKPRQKAKPITPLHAKPLITKDLSIFSQRDSRPNLHRSESRKISRPKVH